MTFRSLSGQQSLIPGLLIIHRCLVCGKPLRSRMAIEAKGCKACRVKSPGKYRKAIENFLAEDRRTRRNLFRSQGGEGNDGP
jgi:hypothetical protein